MPRRCFARSSNGARANPLLEGMHRRLTGEGLESVNLYVASFSEDPDSLAQWRAYGGPMSSFCLGFDTSGMSLASPFVIVRCIYEEERQRAIIRNLVGEILERLQKLPREITRTPRFAEPYINLLPRLALHRLALILKHPKFAEEKEWRIISSSPMMETAPNEGEVPLDFREGKSILVPYRRLPLRNNVNDFPLAEVVVGPNLNPEQSVRSVCSLLRSQGLTSCSVRRSEVPYRNW